MNSKNKQTLAAIFKDPVQSNVLWLDVEKLLINLGSKVKQGNGSRVRFSLNGVQATFHRPHPQKETDKGALVSVRKFLEHAGVKPC